MIHFLFNSVTMFYGFSTEFIKIKYSSSATAVLPVNTNLIESLIVTEETVRAAKLESLEAEMVGV